MYVSHELHVYESRTMDMTAPDQVPDPVESSGYRSIVSVCESRSVYMSHELYVYESRAMCMSHELYICTQFKIYIHIYGGALPPQSYT